jgi:hypothetical protein
VRVVYGANASAGAGDVHCDAHGATRSGRHWEAAALCPGQGAQPT